MVWYSKRRNNYTAWDNVRYYIRGIYNAHRGDMRDVSDKNKKRLVILLTVCTAGFES